MSPRVLVGALFLGLPLVAHSATLRSTIDVKRSAGTATARFEDPGMPSFLITGTGDHYTIQPNGTTTVGTGWEFLTGQNGHVRLFTTPTVDLADATLGFTIRQTTIDDQALTLSTDRFHPDPVAYIIGRLDGNFYAFEVAKWNPGNERFRIYADAIEIHPLDSSSGLISTPEPSTTLTLASLTALACTRRRRPR